MQTKTDKKETEIYHKKMKELYQKLQFGLSRQKTKEVGISTASLYTFLKQYPELKK